MPEVAPNEARFEVLGAPVAVAVSPCLRDTVGRAFLDHRDPFTPATGVTESSHRRSETSDAFWLRW
jgi:hypothetical protein